MGDKFEDPKRRTHWCERSGHDNIRVEDYANHFFFLSSGRALALFFPMRRDLGIDLRHSHRIGTARPCRCMGGAQSREEPKGLRRRFRNDRNDAALL